MRIVMMGTGTFAEPTFEAVLASPYSVVGLVTQPDRVAGQERGSTRQTGRGIKAIAREHSIPIFQPESINTSEGGDGLRALQPDLLVVAAYGQILSRDVLAIASQGGINVHASLLPKYRGAAPVAWAIYHGETHTGVTIIRMSVHLDAGEMLAQEALAIEPAENAGELEARLALLGARLATQVLAPIAAGTARGIPQDKTQVTKAPKLTKELGLIDWSQAARQVSNQVRAMQPWPTAYTFLHRAGQSPMRLIITRAIPAETSAPANQVPGALITSTAEPGRFLVAAGNGSVVEIQELQPAGKRRMAALDFLRGHRLGREDRLGPETP